MKGLPILYAGLGIAAAAAGLAIAWKVKDTGQAVADAAGDVLQAVNPVNPDNIAAKAVNSVVRAVTGEPDATLGTKIYEWLNPGQVAAEARISDPVVIPKPSAAREAADLGELGINTDLPNYALNGISADQDAIFRDAMP